MKKYVIFDIDGTLNQTALYAIEAYQKALKKRNITVSDDVIFACIGLSQAAIITKLFGSLDDNAYQVWRKDIQEYEFSIMKDRAKTFDGIVEVLCELKRRGYQLAICSNAYPKHIKQVLTMIGIYNYFSEIGSLKMGNSKAEVLTKLLEKLNCQKACLVGDRKFDLEAARVNHIPLIGCGYGYAPNEIQEADVVINKPLEILEVIDYLI